MASTSLIVMHTFPAAHTTARADLDRFASQYSTDLRRALTPTVRERFRHICRAEIAEADGFAGRLADLRHSSVPQAQPCFDFFRRTTAETVPAIVALTGAVLERAATDQNAVLDRLQDRNDRLQLIFLRMVQVMRMIRTISVNTSIEAARIDGGSAQTLRQISQEITALAETVTQLVRQARDEVDGPERGAETASVGPRRL